MWYKIRGTWRSEDYINKLYIDFKETFATSINMDNFNEVKYIEGLIRLGIVTDIANYLTVIKELHPGISLVDYTSRVLKIQENTNKYKLCRNL